MTVAPWAVARSERDLGAPLWALAKGLEEVARYNAARGAGRDVKQLKGYENLWEPRRHGRPVRINFKLTPEGPVVVGIFAKQNDEHQKRLLDRIAGWLSD